MSTHDMRRLDLRCEGAAAPASPSRDFPQPHREIRRTRHERVCVRESCTTAERALDDLHDLAVNREAHLARRLVRCIPLEHLMWPGGYCGDAPRAGKNLLANGVNGEVRNQLAKVFGRLVGLRQHQVVFGDSIDRADGQGDRAVHHPVGMWCAEQFPRRLTDCDGQSAFGVDRKSGV